MSVIRQQIIMAKIETEKQTLRKVHIHTHTHGRNAFRQGEGVNVTEIRCHL